MDEEVNIPNGDQIAVKRVRDEFYRIKALGFTRCDSYRALLSSGAAGEHFEHLLGVQENNLREPDFDGWEIKTKRATGGYSSLFNIAPDTPGKTSELVREQFGKVNEDWPDHKKLYCSLYHHRNSKVYKRWLMRLRLDDKQGKMDLVVCDLNGKLVDDSIYWNYEKIKEYANRKLKNTFLVDGIDERMTADDSTKEFRYYSASAYFGFSFDKFLNGIREGIVQYDFRLSTYSHNSVRAGQLIDKGCGFRLKGREFYQNLFEASIDL